jgi:SAM-dependent methyltransferase
VARFRVGADSGGVVIGSTVGYLLRHFVERGISCLGVDPAAAAAKQAEDVGVITKVAFFGCDLAGDIRREGGAADLIIANNVLAHVPDLNDAVGGIARLLKPRGTITAEFPHLLELIRNNQFDTIYHEHHSYFSLIALSPVFERHGLTIYDAERLTTHGGSLRIYAGRKTESGSQSPGLHAILADEQEAGLHSRAAYRVFGEKVIATKRSLLRMLISLKEQGKSIAAYGAPAKAASLLNYCGIGTDFIDFTVDRNPAKQGRLIAGTRIPILAPDAIDKARPDYLVILPWNLRQEIVADMGHIRAWGGQFIVPIPTPEIF